MKLPEVGEYGKYVLSDGSIIYPSGNDYSTAHGETVKMPDAGKWMLWRKTGVREESGRKVSVGEFAMNNWRLIYFKSPIAALRYLEEMI